jgi:hypothetical protein
MLSSVLRNNQAVRVNVEIMRAFVRLRGLIGHNRELAKRLDDLESKYDRQFKVVFDAIRERMTPPQPAPKRRIGFVATDEDPVRKSSKAIELRCVGCEQRLAHRLVRNPALQLVHQVGVVRHPVVQPRMRPVGAPDAAVGRSRSACASGFISSPPSESESRTSSKSSPSSLRAR